MSTARHRALFAAMAILGSPPALAEPAGTQQLIGTFVGSAADELRLGDQPEQRDIVMEIAAYRERGLQVQWHNVTLVDGRRDLPGVKFRRDAVTLMPAPDRSFYLAQLGYDPFSERKTLDPVGGDPMRWGVVGKDSLDLYTIAIRDDGSYELQTTHRHPEGDGVALVFERVVAGELVRRMAGHAVRAE